MVATSGPAVLTILSRMQGHCRGVLAGIAVVLTSSVHAQSNAQAASLRQMLLTVNAGDASGYARLYSPDAVVTIYGSGELRGRAAIERHELELLKQFPGTRLAFYDVWQDGARAAVHYAVNGQTPDGRTMGHEGLLFFQFDAAGLIVQERRYLDSVTPMAQLGILRTPARSLPKLPADLRLHIAGTSAQERKNLVMVGELLSNLSPDFLPHLADRPVIHEMTLPQSFAGAERVTAWQRIWRDAVPDARVEVTGALAAGEFVLIETILRGTLRQPIGVLQPAGKPFAAHRASIVHVQAGKVTAVTAFMNSKEIAEALGQWPPR